MKIKVKEISYDELLKLKRPAHKNPRKPGPVLQKIVNILEGEKNRSAALKLCEYLASVPVDPCGYEAHNRTKYDQNPLPNFDVFCDQGYFFDVLDKVDSAFFLTLFYNE